MLPSLNLSFLKETVSDEALFLFLSFFEACGVEDLNSPSAFVIPIQVEPSIKINPDGSISKNRYSFPLVNKKIKFKLLEILIKKKYIDPSLRDEIISFFEDNDKKNFQLTVGVDYDKPSKKLIKFYSHYGLFETDQKNGKCLIIVNGSFILYKKYKKINYADYSHMLKKLEELNFSRINVGTVAGVFDNENENNYSEYHFILNSPVQYINDVYIAVVCLKEDGTVTYYVRKNI